MTTLTSTEIGTNVYNMINGIPIGISGLMTTIVNNQIYFSEQFLDVAIPITAVAEKYQPAITTLSAANVLQLMEGQGTLNKNFSLGELSITKGGIEGSAESMKDYGMEQLTALLDNIGGKISFYQTFT